MNREAVTGDLVWCQEQGTQFKFGVRIRDGDVIEGVADMRGNGDLVDAPFPVRGNMNRYFLPKQLIRFMFQFDIKTAAATVRDIAYLDIKITEL